VLVLGVALLLALAALSLTFTVTLDSLSARHAQQAALAEGQVEGALELAAQAIGDRTLNAPSTGPAAPPKEVGPWPLAGIPVVVEIAPDAFGAYVLEARARVGSSSVRRVLTLESPSVGGLVVRMRP